MKPDDYEEFKNISIIPFLGRTYETALAAKEAECERYRVEGDALRARWQYIKTDIDGARSLLLLLKAGKGSPYDFDTMVDRIIESRKLLDATASKEA